MLDTPEGTVAIHGVGAVPGAADLPFSHKVMLENLLHNEDGDVVTVGDIEALLDPARRPHAIAFHPTRAFLHDTNGVPVLTDLAAMRDAAAERGLDPTLLNPVIPAQLTVDHSVSTDSFARPDAPALNVKREYERNAERYRFLKWGQQAFSGLHVIPPGAGIMHQINVEYLADVVTVRNGHAFPDTVAGTDSHTTMVNGLSVLAWGVGGIEAEAAMLGQPISMLIPAVVGVELVGRLRPGVTATDLVLTITEQMRHLGVVGQIVEFFGPGVAATSIATRCTIANMSPEFGSTAAMFPIDTLTLDYLRLTGRPEHHVQVVEAYAREQGLWHDPDQRPRFDRTVTVDLDTIGPSLAGPRRPQDRVELAEAPTSLRTALSELDAATPSPTPLQDADAASRAAVGPRHGAVAIAAITSCTNTSNPAVMIAAGLVAKKAVERGLNRMPWVKTSLAPGSRVVTDYLERAGLLSYLDKLGFGLVGYGCMTCIGNSGSLLPQVTRQVADNGLVVAAVLSGNRNFDGRINNEVALNYLASPPLVVAYALTGTLELDLTTQPLGTDPDGTPVFLADLWPDEAEIDRVIAGAVEPAMYTQVYSTIFDGDDNWQDLAAPGGPRFTWDTESTYLQRPPFLDLPDTVRPAGEAGPGAVLGDITGGRVLAYLGDSVTTDHICPAGRIPSDSAAGRYLLGKGVSRRDLNSYASRRGNWQVMRLGGFANLRLSNKLADRPGGYTLDLNQADPSIDEIHAVADRYRDTATPLVVLGGKEYGTGSSRDWAAKVTALLGVRAVIAESFERIHRSNLVGMGVLPLQFTPGQSATSLGLDGTEEIDITGLRGRDTTPRTVQVTARHTDGHTTTFTALVRLDTGRELAYYRCGGLLPYILHDILPDPEAESDSAVTATNELH
ncbi:aconitate hydratase AcnA [Nostocoides japonicum]|nr:aconitate hydratase AcnA [Tetrasphaera japonica]